MVSSRAYFVTIAVRGGVPIDIWIKLRKALLEGKPSWAYCREATQDGKPHYHYCVMLDTPTELFNYKNTVRYHINKYFAPDLAGSKSVVVRVCKDLGCLKYLVKDGLDNYEELNIASLESYIDGNLGTAEQIIADNKLYKETKIKYSCDNTDFWVRTLDWSRPPCDVYAEWFALMYEHDGKLPRSAWQAECEFKKMAYRAGCWSREDMCNSSPPFIAEMSHSWEPRSKKRKLESV